MSAVCTWGLKGAFFRSIFLVLSLPAALWVIHHYCVPTLILCFFFFGMTACACVLVTSVPHQHRPYAITNRRLRLFSFQPIAHDFISLIDRTPNLHCHHWIHMSVMAKKPPPSSSATLPALADSHLNLSSLISGSSFVDVDALTSSPTKSTTSHYADAASAASSVSLSFLSSHHEIYSMNSFVMKSYFNANIWIHIIHYSPRSCEFISFVNDMNS